MPCLSQSLPKIQVNSSRLGYNQPQLESFVADSVVPIFSDTMDRAGDGGENDVEDRYGYFLNTSVQILPRMQMSVTLANQSSGRLKMEIEKVPNAI